MLTEDGKPVNLQQEINDIVHRLGEEAGDEEFVLWVFPPMHPMHSGYWLMLNKNPAAKNPQST